MKKVIVVWFLNHIKKIFQDFQLRVLIVRPVQLKIIHQLRNLRNYAIYVTKHALLNNFKTFATTWQIARKERIQKLTVRKRISDQLVEEMVNLADVIDVTFLVNVANVVSSMISW